MATESQLTTGLLKELRSSLPGAVILKHADRFTFGVPDVSVTLFGVTSWWEIKNANPDFRSIGIQDLTALRLAGAGICHYIIYESTPKCQRTLIVHPKDIAKYKENKFHIGSMPHLTGKWCIGHDHKWVCGFVRSIHVHPEMRSVDAIRK